MPPPFNLSLGIELVYSLIVVISCLLIYFKTRELYQLTSYKGIKYFRNTFLFFGITYIIRFFLQLTRTIRIDPILFQHFSFAVFQIALFVMVYSSSMAFIYLLHSLFWKKIQSRKFDNIYFFHIISLVIAFISTLEKVPVIFLLFQTALFLLLIIVSYTEYRKTKNKGGLSGVYLTYLLIFALWIISNILEFVIYFSPLIGWFIYLISITLFLLILFQVLKKLKLRHKK